VTRIAEVCDEIVVVLAPDVDPPALTGTVPIRFAHDAREGEGPLGGLVAGLDVVTTELALVVAGDMPHLAPPVLAELIRVAGDARIDAGALAQGDRVRPLPCVVATADARASASTLLRASARGARSVRGLLGTLRVAVVDEDTWRSLDPSGGTLHDVDEPGDLRSIG
jgi:molybdopterin-guanine dinucleotide biosynthesis protein A